MLIPQEIIRKKRDGGLLSAQEIAFMVQGFVRGNVPDYQMAALAMAIFLKGFTDAETAALLESMIQSGVRYDWGPLRGSRTFVDKHSTGGVGDKTSLVILPLLVADGLDVPMVAGRGLGHTGGTLDKLESLPGLRTQVEADTFKAWVVQEHGAFGAQTEQFVPADKRLYALRDVTATVESEALITASIMSKKLAEGLDALVLDVKFGSGSFMGSYERALGLAQRLVAVGRAAGCRVSAALTNMDEPLGRAAGNALEVAECLDVLQGSGPLDTRELSVQLAARVAMDARRETGEDAFARACARMNGHLASGRAYEIFCRVAVMQGARAADVERRDTAWIGTGMVSVPVAPKAQGRVAAIDTRALGLALIELGGGRKRKEDAIDPRVGLSRIAKIGERCAPDSPLCLVHAPSASDAAHVIGTIRGAFVIVPDADAVAPGPLVRAWI